MLKQAEQPANLLGLCAIPTMQVKGSNFHKILIPVKVLALFFLLKVKQIQYNHYYNMHKEKTNLKTGNNTTNQNLHAFQRGLIIVFLIILGSKNT